MHTLTNPPLADVSKYYDYLKLKDTIASKEKAIEEYKTIESPTIEQEDYLSNLESQLLEEHSDLAILPLLAAADWIAKRTILQYPNTKESGDPSIDSTNKRGYVLWASRGLRNDRSNGDVYAHCDNTIKAAHEYLEQILEYAIETEVCSEPEVDSLRRSLDIPNKTVEVLANA